MEYTINSLHQALFQQVYDVYNIFQNFFGEEYTDLQQIPGLDSLEAFLIDHEVDISNPEHCEISDSVYEQLQQYYLEEAKPFILVWWPEVTVTNEYDRSVKIQDLYAKVRMNNSGRIPIEEHGFQLARSTYNYKQWIRGYTHSHVPPFHSTDYIPDFENPCLGRGPIITTITSLKTECSTATWMLFCQELAMYVTVESVSGIPYVKLESIDNYNQSNICTNNEYDFYQVDRVIIPVSLKPLFRQFITYYLMEGNLSFSYDSNRFICGMPYYDFMLDISNYFIEFFNKHGNADKLELLYRKGMLQSVRVDNGKFYKDSNLRPHQVDVLNGTYLWQFKGNNVCLHVDNNIEQEEFPATTLLNHTLAMYLLNNIINAINYRFNNEYTEHINALVSGNNTTGATEEASSNYRTVYYL